MNQIAIPRNTLIVLCGPAGCGKSTWAARRFAPTQIVSSDWCRGIVSDDRSNQKATPQAFQLMNFIIRQRLALGRLTVADATSVKRQDRKQFLKLARAFNFHAALVVFNIPLDVCLARNSKRDRVVPRQAIALQHAMLEAALSTISSEGFDLTFVLDERTQSTATLKVSRAVSRRSRRPSRKA
ncbi:MAG: AAA family ATPase [Blastocatellia bacterium]